MVYRKMDHKALISEKEIEQLARERNYKTPDYLFPPHGGRPPSDEEVRKATMKYISHSQIFQGKKRNK